MPKKSNIGTIAPFSFNVLVLSLMGGDKQILKYVDRSTEKHSANNTDQKCHFLFWNVSKTLPEAQRTQGIESIT